MTLYLALFLATLIPAIVVGIRRGGDNAIVSLVLLLSFVLANIAWTLPNPIIAQAAGDLLCAALIVSMCSDKWCMGIAALFVFAVFASVVAQFLTGQTILYAQALSALGHAQNIGTWIGGNHDGRTYRVGGEMGRMAVPDRRGVIGRVVRLVKGSDEG